MSEKYILAKDIHGCEDCPLYESECLGGWTSGAGGEPIEPPCCNWNDDDEIYDGMIEAAFDAWEQREAEHKKHIRQLRAKKAVETRKKYAHLNDKYKKFCEWLNNSKWSLLITSRKCNRVYMREIGKRRANFCFNLEQEKLYVIRGKLTLGDRNVLERFENDFKEAYYGERPKDRDYVREYIENISESIKTVNKMFNL